MFLTRMLDRWAVASQQTSRRNALVASTALTQRRLEMDEVEEFLAGLRAASSTLVVAVPVAAHG